MRLSSPSFRDGAPIPRQHTAEGLNLSPALAWQEVPAGTRSLMLLMEDPDRPSPAGTGVPFLHWLLYNVPPSLPGLAYGASRGQLPVGARSGINDYGRPGYDGPDPEDDLLPDRYVFRVFALEQAVWDLPSARRSEILAAIQGFILDTAELTGIYRRSRPPPPRSP